MAHIHSFPNSIAEPLKSKWRYENASSENFALSQSSDTREVRTGGQLESQSHPGMHNEFKDTMRL